MVDERNLHGLRASHWISEPAGSQSAEPKRVFEEVVRTSREIGVAVVVSVGVHASAKCTRERLSQSSASVIIRRHPASPRLHSLARA